MIEAVMFVASILLLVKGSDILSDCAARTAKMFGISDFVIGVTIIALGTSLPEFASGVYASYLDRGEIVLGDILGANIINVGLVLGLTCMIKPLPIRHTEIYSGWIHLFILSMASIVLIVVNGLSRILGLVFAVAYLLYLWKVIREYRTLGVEPVTRGPLVNNILGLILGLSLILIGAKLLVSSIILFAQILGISAFTISLLLMPIGTSMPELTTTIITARKGYSTMALGNIIGSNIANILWVLGVASIVRPIHTHLQQMLPAIIVMLLLAVLLITFKRSKYMIERKEGLFFLMVYVAFVGLNIAYL
ncbi:MAG: calcium/sodium antiporter [Methanosarcinaceae archaeon]|nr:calcium/sodium antiporter [Methanosarcinaceae archaeon]